MKSFSKILLAIKCFILIQQMSFAQGSGIRKLASDEQKELNRSSDIFRLGITPAALMNA